MNRNEPLGQGKKSGQSHTISRAEARVIATRYLYAEWGKRNIGWRPLRITKVIRSGEDGLSEPRSLRLPADRTHLWFAYLSLWPFMIKSSDIIVIDDRTGEVVFEGDAGDEG